MICCGNVIVRHILRVTNLKFFIEMKRNENIGGGACIRVGIMFNINRYNLGGHIAYLVYDKEIFMGAGGVINCARGNGYGTLKIRASNL